ncbi:MAG TPA: alpha/beta fold hydrolase [Gemmatimonadaceae bacterium]|nr:alpha/beta fold hydrolase [Gemmatimonadaceae bacterium]
MPFLITALVCVAAIAAYATVRRRVERRVAARLPLGPGGIVRGAEPIELADGAPAGAVLLLHGFGDSPHTMAHLAGDLHARGYAVYAPLLPGHGRSLREFRVSNADQWIDAGRAALATLRERHERVGIAGLSMGGAIGAILAAEQRDVSALVLLAPYLSPHRTVHAAARMAPLLQPFIPYLFGQNPYSIHDPVVRAQNISYEASTMRLIAELVRVAERGAAALPAITAPTLYLQSREDNRVSIRSAERCFAKVGAREKRLDWLSGSGHVITVDFGWERVVALTAEWMEAHVKPTIAAPLEER